MVDCIFITAQEFRRRFVMYKILEARNLAGPNYEMIVEAPRVAARCLPGQFIIVKLDEQAERIPLTITDYDREKGIQAEEHQPNQDVSFLMR